MLEKLLSDKELEKVFKKKGAKTGKSVFKEKFFLEPYSERIASLIRLIQLTSKEKCEKEARRKGKKIEYSRAVCLCIYIDNKDQVFYSNNIISEENYRSSENEGFLKDIPAVSSLFDKFPSEKQKADNFIFDVFNPENKTFLEILGRNKGIIDEIGKIPESKIGKNIKDLFLIVESFYESSISNQPNQRINDAKRIEEGIRVALKKLNKDNVKELTKTNYLSVAISTLSYIEDFLNVYGLARCDQLKENEKIILKSIANRSIRRAKCCNNKNIHCEMRMWEHISRENKQKISKDIFSLMKEAVDKERFVVSKFCCGNCEICFSSWSQVTNNSPEGFKILGKSNSFFSGWSSPVFEKKDDEEIFEKTKLECLKKISNLDQVIIDKAPLIEDNKSNYLANQVMEFVEITN